MEYYCRCASYETGRDNIGNNKEDNESGRIAKKVHESRLKWYGRVMRKDERYVGMTAMEIKVQRRNRGSPKRIWLNK